MANRTLPNSFLNPFTSHSHVISLLFEHFLLPYDRRSNRLHILALMDYARGSTTVGRIMVFARGLHMSPMMASQTGQKHVRTYV